jgi:hypothetical protein
MRKIKFIENGDGVVDSDIHFASPLVNDFTLCGLSMDGDRSTTGDFVETNERVDCSDCSTIVSFGKKVKKNEL